MKKELRANKEKKLGGVKKDGVSRRLEEKMNMPMLKMGTTPW